MSFACNKVIHFFCSSSNNLTNYEINPPVSYKIEKFHLTIGTFFDFHSLAFILHCMPNLRRLIVTITLTSTMLSLSRNILCGTIWQQLLVANASYLDVFDIFVLIRYSNSITNLDNIIHTFNYFERKFDDWYMGIHRSYRHCNRQSKTDKTTLYLQYIICNNSEQQICLHGFRYSRRFRCHHTNGARVVFGTLNIYSNMTNDSQNQLFYAHSKDLHIRIPRNIKFLNIISSNQLFTNIEYLTIQIDSSIQSCWADTLGFCM